jgi:hypothetical protein
MVRSGKTAIPNHILTILSAALLVAAAPVIGSAQTTSITLAWTAPGDDGTAGTAAGYDLRYSIVPMTTSSFATATQASGLPRPATPGTRQSVVVGGLQVNSVYYFALKTVDASGNWSGMSNVVVYTPPGPGGPPPETPLAFSAPRPNPAKDLTQFVFDLPRPADVWVEVLDVVGRRVRLLADGLQPSGHNVIEWRLDDSGARRVPPGFYLVRARALGQDFIRRLIVVP